MKIIVPSSGPKPDRKTVGYVINIAKRLDAQIIALRILAEKETEQEAEECLRWFVEDGQSQKVPVNITIERGEIASAIIHIARENSVDLIILGLSHGEVIAEWMNAGAMDKTDIPVLLIPKWVPTAKKSSPNG